MFFVGYLCMVMLDEVCCKYTHTLTYSDTQTHFGNTQLYFQFDYPRGSVFMLLPASPC